MTLIPISQMSKGPHRREGAESELGALQNTPVQVRKICAGLGWEGTGGGTRSKLTECGSRGLLASSNKQTPEALGGCGMGGRP